MVSRGEEAKNELLRVRRELATIDDQLEKVGKELDQATELNEKDKIEDARAIRNTLWKEKEHLREQETLLLKALFAEVPVMPPQINFNPNFSTNGTGFVPLLPKPSTLKPAHAATRRRTRQKGAMLHHSLSAVLPAGVLGDPHAPELLAFDAEYTNEGGYEVNRSSDCKVIDVWREWKEGINGGPAIEKLEEARKRDRKMVWWRHKNDYKYWSKQMRIIHAVEKKAYEFGDNMEASIQFWEEILRVEFESSISKLREALGGDKQGAESKAGGGGGGEMNASKRQRKELLQQGLERLKGWPVSTQVPGGGLLGV